MAVNFYHKDVTDHSISPRSAIAELALLHDDQLQAVNLFAATYTVGVGFETFAEAYRIVARYTDDTMEQIGIIPAQPVTLYPNPGLAWARISPQEITGVARPTADTPIDYGVAMGLNSAKALQEIELWHRGF